MNGPPVDLDDMARLDSLVDLGEPISRPQRDGRELPTRIQFIFDGQGSADAPRMLIKGLVPVEGICFIGGQSGAGKTFVGIHMMGCLASGRAFFGRKIKERVGCAILAAEGAGGFQRRLEAAKKAIDLSAPLPIAWRAVNENLLDPRSLRQTIDALKVLDQQFSDEHGVRLGAVFVDTIGAAFGLEDENDAAKVNAAMRVLRQIGDESGASVLPVHHYGKTAATGLRGSSAFRGAADAVISVLAERDEITGESKGRSLCLAKARDGEEGPISSFELRFVHLGFDEDGEPFGSCVVEQIDAPATAKKATGSKLSKGAQIALQALHEAIAECGEIPPASNHIPAGVRCVTISQWRDYAYKRGVSDSDEPRARQIAFKRAHEALVSAGKVAVWEPHLWLV